MSLPSQAIFPGVLEPVYRGELNNLVTGEAIRRLWSKDLSLWPADEEQRKFLSTNLKWLDLPEQISHDIMCFSRLR